MFQHRKATATLPEGFAPPMYKTPLRTGTESSRLIFCTSDTESIASAGSCVYEIPRKGQGTEAKLWNVPAKAKSLICNQQIKHGTGVLRSRETKTALSTAKLFNTQVKEVYVWELPLLTSPHKQITCVCICVRVTARQTTELLVHGHASQADSNGVCYPYKPDKRERGRDRHVVPMSTRSQKPGRAIPARSFYQPWDTRPPFPMPDAHPSSR